MQSSRKIIINTVILYAKILVCMAISLWTVPLLLNSLGQDDYGLFCLIAGVVAMLSFLNGAMTVSVQRFLSVTIGEGDEDKLKSVFSLSIVIHLLLGLIFVVCLELFMPLLFYNGVLSIPYARMDQAILLYHCVVASMFFTMLSLPFDALMNAFEDMLTFSVVSIIEALMRLCVALALPFFLIDKLLVYGVCVAVISFLILLIKIFCCKFKYKGVAFMLSSCRDKSLFLSILGFVGWNTLTSLAFVGRNQGIGVVLNHFFTTAINAAYGIANQINGVLNYFSATIQKSINPQLMISEGRKDRDSMVNLSISLTKFSLLSMGIIAIPLMSEMPEVLHIWLKDDNIPESTVIFCQLIILLSLVYQMSAGLMSAIQSTGKIRYYAIVMSFMLLLNIPLSYIALRSGLPAYVALAIACAVEIPTLVIRLLFAKYLADMPIWKYCSKGFLSCVMLLSFLYVVNIFLDDFISASFWRIVMVSSIDVLLFIIITYRFVLTQAERSVCLKLIRRMKR